MPTIIKKVSKAYNFQTKSDRHKVPIQETLILSRSFNNFDFSRKNSAVIVTGDSFKMLFTTNSKNIWLRFLPLYGNQAEEELQKE